MKANEKNPKKKKASHGFIKIIPSYVSKRIL